MAGKKSAGGGGGEGSKKAQGQARKAEAAAAKQAVEDSRRAAAEDAEWGKGAKSNAKKDAAEQKKAEAARKKAEKDALLKEEEASLKAAKPSSSKKATGSAAATKKKTGGLDLAQLDAGNDDTLGAKGKNASLNATGIDNALDALSLTADKDDGKVDRHPERRFPAALAKYKAAREAELKTEQPGLRKQQREDLMFKEFAKHPDNPFNQVSVRFDASKEEIKEVKEREREKVEKRLAG